MLKSFKRIVPFLLCLVFAFSVGCNDVPSDEQPQGLPEGYINLIDSSYAGSKFKSSKIFELEDNFSSIPRTVEAVVSLPTTYSDRGGVIVGNYNGARPCFNLEISEGGKPRFYYMNGGDVVDLTFSTDIRSSEWVHIALTWTDYQVKLYVDGQEKESKNADFQKAVNPFDAPFCIGGDNRTNNSQYFKGKIKSVAIYSALRTAEEISSDYTSVNVSENSLLGLYMLNDLTSASEIVDLSSNKLDALSTSHWLDEGANVTDYDFSFMVIGDTQIITSEHPDKLKNIYDYVLDNVTSKKVKHVFGVGDITDRDVDSEWKLATEQIARLDGVVPYSVIRGNHDIYSADKKIDKKSLYDDYFGKSDCFYADEYIDCYKGAGEAFKARNTVHEFSSSNRDYLVIALDYGADDDVLSWASDICFKYPNHNVIISTHAYLATNGEYYDSNQGSAPTRDYGDTANNGDHMWEELVSQHENIVMVVCGHAPTDNIVLRRSEGVNGNVVSEILVDPQGMDSNSSIGATGMVATFYVSNDGKSISVEYYSTVKNKFYKSSNIYTFNVNTIER